MSSDELGFIAGNFTLEFLRGWPGWRYRSLCIRSPSGVVRALCDEVFEIL